MSPFLCCRRPQVWRFRQLNRVADVAEDLADPATKEDEGDDRDDRDQCEDECVFRESLAVLVTMEPGGNLEHQAGHDVLPECRWWWLIGPPAAIAGRPGQNWSRST